MRTSLGGGRAGEKSGTAAESGVCVRCPSVTLLLTTEDGLTGAKEGVTLSGGW